MNLSASTTTTNVISADSHVCEVPATWERAQRLHGDLAPRVVIAENGTFLVVDGWTDHERGLYSRERTVPKGVDISPSAYVEDMTHEYIGIAIGKSGRTVRLEREKWRGGTGSFTGTGSFEAERFMRTFRQEDYPGPGNDPAARLEDQDADDVAAEILYPSFLGRLYAMSATNEPFFRDLATSYNEWLLDFASYAPRRLIPQPVLSVLDPATAAEDLVKYAKRGVKACAIASSVPLGTSYGDPKFDPLWAAAEQTGMVLAMHQLCGGFKHLSNNQDVLDATDALSGRQNLRQFMGPQMEIIITLSELIYGGVFDRFPTLRIVAAEFDIGWVAHIYQRKMIFNPALGLKLAPSEYLQRNAWFTFQDDRAGCLTTPLFGADNFMWASDYPHPATTWPNSSADLERQFAGVSDEVRRKLTRHNVVRLYGLDG